MKKEISVYIHVPFCLQRCVYCDFNTYAGFQRSIPAYIDALVTEIRGQYSNSDRPTALPVKSIYFGGGTPSLLTPEQINRVITAIQHRFSVRSDAEITLEANPGTVTFNKLTAYRQTGINRISLGVQSIHPKTLRILGRIHTYENAIDAWKWARHAGFANISFDLIFGLPNQTLQQWEATLRIVVGLHPEHLSIYSLIIEPGTPLSGWVEHGLVFLPDEDESADMYDFARIFLAREGYTQYEISNWAIQPSTESIHNKQYWLNQPYLGFGAGAHSFIAGVRQENIRHFSSYINRMKQNTQNKLRFPLSPAGIRIEKIGKIREMRETMMMGLRLTQDGVNNAKFKDRFGRNIEDAFPRQIRELRENGLAEWTKHHQALRLTKRGVILGNLAFVKFV